MTELATAEERGEVREAYKGVVATLREALAGAGRLNPESKLGGKCIILLSELTELENRVGELGETAFMRLLCANVAKGVPLEVFCGESFLNDGLVAAWIAESPERKAWYESAQEIAADRDVAGTVKIADDAPETKFGLGKAALRINTKFRRAGVYNPERFGKKQVHEHKAVGDFGEMLRRARERVIEGEVVRA